MRIAIVEDHLFWRQILEDLIKKQDSMELTMSAINGKDFIQQLQEVHQESAPELVITDLAMPFMNGIQLSNWLHQNKPEIKVIVLAIELDLPTTVRLLKLGVKGFLDKNARTETLFAAIDSVVNGQFYFSTIWEGDGGPTDTPPISNLAFEILDKWASLNENEKNFISLSCSELSMAEIAQKMGIRMDVMEQIRRKVYASFGVSGQIGLVKLIISSRLLES